MKNFIKYILILFLLVFAAEKTNAKCLIPSGMQEKCEKLKQEECPKGTIYTLTKDVETFAYSPICVSCDSENYIPLYCVSVEEARKLCPNRYISYGCGKGSVKDCVSDFYDKNIREKTCTVKKGIIFF